MKNSSQNTTYMLITELVKTSHRYRKEGHSLILTVR